MKRDSPTVVFLASVPWNFALPQRARFLCEALLASGQSSVHVDIPLRSAPLAWLRQPKGEPHILRPELRHWRSWWSLSEKKQKALASKQAKRLRVQITERHNPESLVVVVETPQWLPWLEGLGVKRIVYDRIDEVSAHAPSQEMEEQLRVWEAELIDRCSGVVVSSRQLEQPVRERRPDLRLRHIPNGVDTRAFARLADTGHALPEMTALPRPLVGFIGALYHWVDVELIDSVTSALPHMGFVFIGPMENSAKPTERPNVRLLGPVAHEHVPACISAFDVGWIPFRNNAVGRASNPLKLYEYLALGKPVVTTPIVDPNEFEGLVAVGQSADEIVALLRQAVNANNLSKVEKRQTFSLGCSWTNRAETLMTYLEELPE